MGASSDPTGGTSFAEGPNAGKDTWIWESRVAIRLKIQVAGPFGTAGKGEAQTALFKAAEANPTVPTV